MHEHVLAAALDRDEAIAFVAVEPLHSALRHPDLLVVHGAAPGNFRGCARHLVWPSLSQNVLERKPGRGRRPIRRLVASWLFHPGGRGQGLPDRTRSQESAMTSDDKPRRVEVRDGDQTVAAAELAERAEGTIRTSLLPSSGPAPPGTRADLVDAVMDLPEVQASS